MVSLVLITHESLGASLIECAQHIMCVPVTNLAQLAVSKHDDPDEVCKRAQMLVHSMDRGSGILLLTDIFGGTPSNIATRLIIPGQVEAIAGVNLPMLVRALTYSEQPLPIVIQKALMGGQEGVLYITPPFTESS
jgi:PTS system ascorbate-specific IIA component